MRIALCFLGLYRNFDKNYKNLFKTFIDDKKYETDIYLSTWEEKEYCIESRVKKLIPREIFIDVERQNNQVSEGYKMFGAQYNQLYKQRRVSNLIKKVDKNYDFVILTRTDIEYHNKFNIDEYFKNILYVANGYYYENSNIQNQFWKNRANSVDKYLDIYKIDYSSRSMIPKNLYIQPICDQFYIASPNILDEFTEQLNLLDTTIEWYKKCSRKKKRIQKIIYFLYSKITLRSPHEVNRIVFFPIYRFLSKSFGAFIPFKVDSIKSFNPTTFSYQCAFRNLNIKVSSLDYSILNKYCPKNPFDEFPLLKKSKKNLN